MICAQAFYINAIALADASYIAPFSYMTLIFVTFYDFALFDEIPDYISLIGISIIFAPNESRQSKYVLSLNLQIVFLTENLFLAI